MTTTPAVTTPVPAKDGDVWGSFVFSANPRNVTVTETPAPIGEPPDPGAYESIPFQHPGYRQFRTADELAAFIGKRAQVLAPASVPAESVLLGTWAVELQAGGPISDTGISYRFANSAQSVEDPDIWIASVRRYQRPLVISSAQTNEPNGQVSGVPERVTVLGYPGVYLPTTNPPDIATSLQFRSAISWFDDAGVFWSVQGRNLDFETLFRIAESLRPLASPAP